MTGFVDIHTHLLPGIDDGPEDLEGSLDMARAALAAGISTIAATPHLRADFPGVNVEELGHRCAQLRDALAMEAIALNVVSGAEVSLLWALEASEEALKLASYAQRGTDLLIETPNDISQLDRLLTSLLTGGYRITLAHPERSIIFRRDVGVLERLSEQGVLLQVNAATLRDRRGTPRRRLAEHLCRHGLTHLISSDAHRAASWRPVTALPDALAPLARLVGSERAEWMTSSAPGAVLAGDPLPAAPGVEVGQRRRWLLRRG